jgi:4a-hydroxytetrahydrobiopterin dehydratase
MTDLSAERCQECRPGAPAVSVAEARTLLAELPGWAIVERDGVRQLERVFTFPDFVRALAFTNRVGALAEAHGHHPALLTEWGRVTVRWWTHTISGLHRNDFVMAAKTDRVTSDRDVSPGPS